VEKNEGKLQGVYSILSSFQYVELPLAAAVVRTEIQASTRETDYIPGSRNEYCRDFINMFIWNAPRLL
jgi:hypothetical protein